MPDDDKVHAKLPAPYQRPYKQICESRLSSLTITQQLARALVRDLKHMGDEPIEVLGSVAKYLDAQLFGPLQRSMVDCSQLERQIDVLVRQSCGGRQAIHIAHTACLQFTADLRLGKEDSGLDTFQDLAGRYANVTFERRFVERVPQQRHHRGASEQAVQTKRKEVTSGMCQSLDAIAEQIPRLRSVQKLRCPRGVGSQVSVDMDENIAG